MVCQFIPGEITVSRDLATLATAISADGHGFFDQSLIEEVVAKFAQTGAVQTHFRTEGHGYDYDATCFGITRVDVQINWHDIARGIKDGDILVEGAPAPA